MTKTSGKIHPEGQPSAGPSQEEIRTAYEIHTLSQMLYGQLAMTHPWLAMPPVHGGPGMWNAGSVSQPITAPQMFGMEMYPH
jgi:hypothetical protein